MGLYCIGENLHERMSFFYARGRMSYKYLYYNELTKHPEVESVSPRKEIQISPATTKLLESHLDCAYAHCIKTQEAQDTHQAQIPVLDLGAPAIKSQAAKKQKHTTNWSA